MAWADEFNAGESLSGNSGKWYFESGGSGWGNNELQYYCNNGTITLSGTTYNTASVSSEGTLKITAYKVAASNRTGNKEYISARMSTKDSWTHGYIEMRAKLPTTKGCWSAFWMLLADGPSYVRDESRTGGEIDIIEHVPLSNVEAKRVYFSAHSYNATPEAGADTGYVDPVTGAQYSYTGYATVQTPGQWHTYSMLWTHESIRAFVDGQQYYFAPNPIPNNVGQADYRATWPFDQAYYIKLNLAVGGDWGGTPASSFSEETFEIDYIRVYQR